MVEAEMMNHQLPMQEVQNLIPGLPDEIAMECLIRVPYKFHSSMKSVCHRWQNLVSSVSFYQERGKSGKAEHLVCQLQHFPRPKDKDSSPELVCDYERINNSSSNNKKEEDEQHQQLRGQNQNQQQINSPPQYGLTIFNASNQTWQRTSPNFGKIPMFCQCVAIPDSGKLLLLGGWDPETLEPVQDVYVIDMIKGLGWKRACPMSVARSFFACAVVGNSSVYVAGGHDNQKNALKSAEVYDVEADEWKMLPDMEEERDECMGLSWEGDDRFWVVSGYGTESQGRFKSDVECYDPITGCWSQIDGLWPFPSISPRGSTATITSSANTSGQQQHQWLWFLTKEQQQLLQSQQQQNGGLKGEIVSSIVQLPSSITGISPCVSVTSFGYGGLDYNKYNQNSQQQQQRVFVMTGNGRRGSSSSSSSSSSICNECEGEGAFIVERDNSNGNIKWAHVHTPLPARGSHAPPSPAPLSPPPPPLCSESVARLMPPRSPSHATVDLQFFERVTCLRSVSSLAIEPTLPPPLDSALPGRSDATIEPPLAIDLTFLNGPPLL